MTRHPRARPRAMAAPLRELQEPGMTGAPTPPLAFIYDRNATRSRAMLEMRISGCRTYAERQGWEVAGWWVDFGDEALGKERPELGALVGVLVRMVVVRRAFCLVHHWNRFAHDIEGRHALQRRVARVGGYSATTFGESDARAGHERTGYEHAEYEHAGSGHAGNLRVPAAETERPARM
ncbi:recombinase family protein [Streptomyces sp. NPDC018045]|uniref:recombinase family protein n=1 Tax=Streptomyces sp. NPDC018045 TaxID=3365037 RepID=UPI003798A594